MTKRKNGGGPTRIELSRFRLNRIATQLMVGWELDQDDLDWLAFALMHISYGGDANTALEVKAGRGERVDFEAQLHSERMTCAMAWIVAATAPSDAEALEDRGLGLSLNDAIERAAKSFRIKFDTLENHWHAHPHKRVRNFVAPLSSGPIVRKKEAPGIE